MEHDELHAQRARLRIERGARRQVIDRETGNVTADHEEPGAVCAPNIGDRVMLFGPAMDEIAVAEVVTIYPSGTSCYVAIKSGHIERTTRAVRLVKMAKARRSAP